MMGVLELAIFQPQATFGDTFLHGDLFEMAAAYLYHIVQNHSFFDGNKRTGTAIVFLSMNDVSLVSNEDGLVEITLKVATGQAQKNEIAEFFRTHAQ